MFLAESVCVTPNHDPDTGDYVERISLDDVLDVLGEIRGPVLHSSDVAEELDCDVQTARRKLGKLEEQKELKCRKIGQYKVYWRDSIAMLALPGSGDKLDERRDAVRTIHEFLKNRGRADQEQIREQTDIDIQATGYDDFSSFFSNCLKNGAVLEEIEDITFQKFPHEYYYHTED